MVVQAPDFDGPKAASQGGSVACEPAIVSIGARNRDLVCPRCESPLYLNYDEPQCIQCGYVDYRYVPPDAHKKKRSLVSMGTRFVLRYRGMAKALSDTLAHVQVRRRRNKVIFLISCPFCNSEMTLAAVSGKRREMREEMYKCRSGHRIALLPSLNGMLGWR